MTRFETFVGLAVIAASLALVSCSTPDSEVASLPSGGNPSPVPTPSPDGEGTVEQQRQSAKSLASCLQAKGINASTLDVEVGGRKEGPYLDLWIAPPEDQPDFAYGFQAGGIATGTKADPTTGKLVATSGEKIDEDQLWLEWDGIDRTDVLQQCVTESGYWHPKPVFDPKDEETQKQQIVEVMNKWAQCARENGLPGLADATLVVDNWETEPNVYIPSTTNLDLFKNMLQACDPVDPDRDLTAPAINNTEPTVIVDRWIQISGDQDSANAVDLKQAITDRVNQLYDQARK